MSMVHKNIKSLQVGPGFSLDIRAKARIHLSLFWNFRSKAVIRDVGRGNLKREDVRPLLGPGVGGSTPIPTPDIT